MGERKPGWKTSEYWLSIAAFVISTVVLGGGFIENEAVIQALSVLAGLLGGSYSVGRSLVKSAEAKRDAMLALGKKD